MARIRPPAARGPARWPSEGIGTPAFSWPSPPSWPGGDREGGTQGWGAVDARWCADVEPRARRWGRITNAYLRKVGPRGMGDLAGRRVTHTRAPGRWALSGRGAPIGLLSVTEVEA